MVKNLFVWLWYTLINNFISTPPFTLIITEHGTAITIWESGEIYIHEPHRINLETTFGRAWKNTKLNFFGKVLHGTANCKAKSIKEGQTIRFYHSTLRLCSHPMKIKAVYHDSHIQEQEFAWKKAYCLSDEPDRLNNFTSIAEYNYYSSIIRVYLYLANASKNDYISLQTLIKMMRQRNIPQIFIEDLIQAQILVQEGPEDFCSVHASRALLYILIHKFQEMEIDKKFSRHLEKI